MTTTFDDLSDYNEYQNEIEEARAAERTKTIESVLGLVKTLYSWTDDTGYGWVWIKKDELTAKLEAMKEGKDEHTL
jgi:hypothetical protein